MQFDYEITNRDIPWKPFGSYEGFVYRILDVNPESRTVDMLFHFEPNRDCFYHRHLCGVASLVLEGQHRIREPDGQGSERLKLRSAGEFSFSAGGDTHIEGGGPEGAVVYFSFRGSQDHIYDILDENLNLVREVSVQDFKRAFDRW